MIHKQRPPDAHTEHPLKFTANDFPLKARLAEYLLRYLPVGTLLEPSVKISFDVIAEDSSSKIAEQLLSRFSDSATASKLKEALRESTGKEELTQLYKHLYTVNQLFRDRTLKLLHRLSKLTLQKLPLENLSFGSKAQYGIPLSPHSKLLPDFQRQQPQQGEEQR